MLSRLETADGYRGFVEFDKVRQLRNPRRVRRRCRQILYEVILVMLFFRLDGRCFHRRRELDVVMRIRTWPNEKRLHDAHLIGDDGG